MHEFFMELKLGVEKSRVEMSFNLDTILAIRSASSLGIAKTKSTGPVRQLTTGVWGTLEVFKLSYRTIHKFLKVLYVTFYMLIQKVEITRNLAICLLFCQFIIYSACLFLRPFILTCLLHTINSSD